jgi:hypothetical protein
MLTATRTFLLFFSEQATCPKGHTAANKLGDEIAHARNIDSKIIKAQIDWGSLLTCD